MSDSVFLLVLFVRNDVKTNQKLYQKRFRNGVVEIPSNFQHFKHVLILASNCLEETCLTPGPVVSKHCCFGVFELCVVLFQSRAPHQTRSCPNNATTAMPEYWSNFKHLFTVALAAFCLGRVAPDLGPAVVKHCF